jgi:two-component system nitrate/nitrite response regulator NarL
MIGERARRVLLCDDHAVFAEAVAKLLRNRGLDAVVCLDPAAAEAAVCVEHFDVCLMDVVFDSTGMVADASDAGVGDRDDDRGDETGVEPVDGVTGIRRVRAARPETAVIALTGVDDDELVRRCRRSGASAFVSKTASADALLDAIDRACIGGPYFTARDATPVVDVTDPDAGARLASLTGREREVLARMVAGQTAAVVARELGVTYATARTHVQRVLVKLGAHSSVEAVAFAARHGVRPHESARAS